MRNGRSAKRPYQSTRDRQVRIRFSSRTDRSIHRAPVSALGASKGETLAIDDRTRQQLPERRIVSEQQDRRPSRHSPTVLFDEKSHFVEKVQIRQIDPGPVPGPSLIGFAIPPDAAGIEGGFRVFPDRLAVVVLIRRVAEQSFDLSRRASFIAGAAADERLADVAAEIDRLVLPARLGDMEDEQGLAVFFDQPFLHRDDAIQLLAGTENAEELVLDLVDLHDPDDLEAARAVPNAEDQPAALGVGEGGDRLVGVLGNAPLRLS